MFAALIRLPALHFLLIGAALFAATARTPRGAAAARAVTVRAPIVIPATTIAELREDHRRMMGAPPTAAELTALLEREADREILYREALLLGLDRADPAVEVRVIEKMRFLYGDDAGSDTDTFRRGLALGLHRDDIVVRRTLVTKMQLLAKRASRTQEPEGAALERALAAHLEQHPERYMQPATVSLRHVFFSTDRRGPTVEADAEAWRRRVGSTPPGTAPSTGGDVFALGHELRGRSHRGLAKIFGTDFADAVMTLETGTWSGPVRSSYGVHLVWITEKVPARVPALPAVRARVLRAYRAAQHEIYLDELMGALRGMYEIRTEQAHATKVDDA